MNSTNRITAKTSLFFIGASVLVLSALAFSASARAQTPVDAGALRQQIEQSLPAPLPRKLLPAKPSEPPALVAPAGLTVTVKAFRFAGNTLIGAEQLAPAIAAYLDRPVGMTELRSAAAAVAEVYRQAGWVVRAYLPQQDIKDGIVTIQIVEAVFGGILFDGAEPQRLPRAIVLSMVAAAQSKGENLNDEAIDRALLLIDDLPGVAASGKLRPGSNTGETDLALALDDEPLLRTEMGLDNTGSRSTGDLRLLANLSVNSPLALGDLLSANLLHTQGSDYLRVSFTLPVGSAGWRAGINTSTLGYRLVAPEFIGLNGKGSSGTLGLEATYPVIRSRLKNLYFNAAFDRKTFDNQANGAVTTRYRADVFTLGLSGNLFDKFGGGGANSASLAFLSGKLDLDNSPNQAADAATTRTAGQYTKLRYTLSRQQVITDELSFYAALAGQRAGKNLDSSEKFSLGGVDGLRAYPSGEGSGSHGQLLKLELRQQLLKGMTLVGFYDVGHVTVNQNNTYAGALVRNDLSYKGAGLALNWQADSGVTARLSWARRLGENPNPTATGRDQDGSLDRDRLWLSLTLSI